MVEILSDIIVKAVFGALASMGFAVLFNVRKSVVPWCGACGALGLGLRTVGLHCGLPLVYATLIGSTAVGFFALWPHSRFTLPTHVVSIPGTINMVPGVFAYKAMSEFMSFAVTRDPMVFHDAAHSFLSTFYVLMAIALGLVLPSLCLRIDKKTL